MSNAQMAEVYEQARPNERPCKTCHWARLSWLRRAMGAWDLARCEHPRVLSDLHLATRQGWLIPDYGYIEPWITFPNPVTGEPGRRWLLCSVARKPQWKHERHCARAGGQPVARLATVEERATSNCGPDGRYWEPRR